MHKTNIGISLFALFILSCTHKSNNAPKPHFQDHEVLFNYETPKYTELEIQQILAYQQLSDQMKLVVRP